MNTRTISGRYSIREEVANSLTHLLGILFSITGMVILILSSSESGNIWRIISCVVFGMTLILLYTASTLYHGIQNPSVKAFMRIIDHSSIFLLIAGTYTPFTLVNLRGPWGWSLFGIVWGLAFLGIIVQTALLRQWVGISVGLYVIMGWAVVVAIKQMLVAVAPPGMMLLLAGGLAYTFGIIFYVWHRLPYHHAVWHLFVLAGSIFHFFAVLFYAVPLEY
ncbi:PAQR family membrane homeostasis protein TrhA [Desulfomonile tiedjei]|uniref:Channel protein, hemolysin III family n=1 Tax=Desulfomonile tiedjei (strain ATCC 49306 / DSM 6799 / DCB-1) TaxID=706587 RepID=I4C8W6_DESTA|nr:hemolysin III family protein [Desulfomonile tiedjei]AFM26007.1 channel protein, hemolysin III family [Desulfomonile tiedjei DSM 6799]